MSTIQNLRKSLVRNWKPVRSLVGDGLSGAEFAPFWLWLAPAWPLPLAGDGPVHSRLALLWYLAQSLVLCAAQQRLRLGLLQDSSFFLSFIFSLSGYPTD